MPTYLQTKLIIALIAFIFFIATSVQAAEEPPLTHSLTAVSPPIPSPLMKLNNMDEELVDIESMRGKTIVVNFWATWCPPCRREMTSLEELHIATKDKNVIVLAVDIGEDIETVFSFISSIEPSPSFPILFDTDSLVMEKWKVQGLPTTYVINPEGDIVYKAVGGREFNHPDILEKILNIKAPEQDRNERKK